MYMYRFHNFQKNMVFKELAMVSIKGNSYIIHFLGMNKDKSINLMKNVI